jgi:hypothetical protein
MLDNQNLHLQVSPQPRSNLVSLNFGYLNFSTSTTQLLTLYNPAKSNVQK